MYAVISDVHSNLESLISVLKDIKSRGIRDIFFLGDAVGYGPEPNECIELLKAHCRVLLAGNHDWGVCGLTDTKFFNENARIAIEWSKGVISRENLEALREFPLRVEIRNEDLTFVHSTPMEPQQWHYLLSVSDAEANFPHFDSKFCFIGHSHRPFIVERSFSGDLLTNRKGASINPDSRYIINIGSVGQPRDRDPRSSYAVVGAGRVEIVRVGYNIEATQRKMHQAGLPVFLIERLSAGM